MKPGRIEVITGCMFSGKSEELIRRLRRAVIARKRVAAFKPSIDDRYSVTDIGSHTGQTFQSQAVKTLDDIRERSRGAQVVGIDEAQFFGEGLADLCEDLANIGVRVIVAGLDMDSDCNPFGDIPRLMCLAEEVVKLHAVCVVCGEMPATRSIHKTGKTGQVEVGADQYEARCRGCSRQ